MSNVDDLKQKIVGKLFSASDVVDLTMGTNLFDEAVGGETEAAALEAAIAVTLGVPGKLLSEVWALSSTFGGSDWSVYASNISSFKEDIPLMSITYEKVFYTFLSFQLKTKAKLYQASRNNISSNFLSSLTVSDESVNPNGPEKLFYMSGGENVLLDPGEKFNIDEILIRNKDFDNVDFPQALLENEVIFEQEIVSKINMTISKADHQIGSLVVMELIEGGSIVSQGGAIAGAFGLVLGSPMLAALSNAAAVIGRSGGIAGDVVGEVYMFPPSGQVLDPAVYKIFETQKDDGVPAGSENGIELNELLNTTGQLREDEIPQVNSVTGLSLESEWNLWEKGLSAFKGGDLTETNLLNDRSPVDGTEILHGFYIDYIRFLVKIKEELEPATSQQAFTFFTDLAAVYIADIIKLWYVYDRRLTRFEALAQLNAEDFEGADADEIAVAALGVFSDAQEALNERLQDYGQGASELETEIDVEARQKFYEQCALLSVLGDLSSQYQAHLKGELFSPRLYLVEDNVVDTSANMNKLLLPRGKSIKSFLEITPDVASMLIPKIRLFSVRTGKNGKLVKKEFEFPTSSPANIEQVFAGGNGIVKGSDFGIKSFSFSFEGTSPATARKDIKAKLSLFFQDFQDFVKKRDDSPRFVDLIMFDRNEEKPTGFGAINKNQYNPAHYRILAEVGWQIPSGKNVIAEINNRQGIEYAELKSALEKTNRSFYLNMVEHNMNFKDDGTFEITAQYQAYIESALKGPEFDALATPDIVKRRIERERQLEDLIDQGICNAQGLAELSRAFGAEDVELIKESYQSIIARLLCRSRIFTATVSAKDLAFFQTYGYFSKPCTLEKNTLNKPGLNQLGELTKHSASPHKETINYFFLGDLIYTILDTVFDSKNTFNKNLINTKFILFPFESQGFQGESLKLNLAFIPISVDFFIEWFTDNVISTGRTAYPIMNFIRDLSNKLVSELLAETCRYRPLENKWRFNTGNILAKASTSGTDPLGNLTSGGKKPLDVDRHHKANNLPLKTAGGGDTDIDKYWNYIMLYPVYSNIQHVGLGDFVKDSDRGVYHFDIGADRGLVKKMKFSKVDMQYIREARFLQQGAQGLAQLQAVYRASIDMIGNTLYYPGMEIYINPRGLGGGVGSPTSPTSIANTLGFGGYHMVERVQSTITPSSFTTNIEAMFTYAGDGISPALNVAIGKNENKSIEEPPPRPSAECNTIIRAAEANVYKLYDAEEITNYENLSSISPTDRSETAAAEAEIDEGFNSGIPTVDETIYNPLSPLENRYDADADTPAELDSKEGTVTPHDEPEGE
jgi:hypothetical protein